MTVERCDAACFDCGLLYGQPGFPDLVLPHDVWAKISPSRDEGGLLCPTCICARTQEAGIECVAMWRSGPFAGQDDALSKMTVRAEAAEAELAALRASLPGLLAAERERICADLRRLMYDLYDEDDTASDAIVTAIDQIRDLGDAS